jgi:ATP-dependent metalloprotease
VLVYVNVPLCRYGLPHEVIRRVTSGKFAVDAIILDHFCTAIARVRNLPEKDLNELRVRLKEEWQAYGDDANAYINPAVLQAAAGPALHMVAPVHAPSGVTSSSWMPGYGSTGPAMSSVAARPVAAPAVSNAFLASMPGTRQNPLVVEAFAGRRDFTSTIVRYISIAGMFALVYYLLNNVVNKGVGGMGGGLSQLVGDSAEEVTEVPTTRFSDVKGADEAKQELEDVVAFLRDPEKYRRLGAKVPRGVLLTGPPGTGKTLLARAVAGEAGCKFYSKSASEFEEMLVGLGARRVRDLFNAARKSAPSIIFIDEIDALGGKRKVSVGAGAERQTLNQLLSSMDGFTKNENVIVIAATNSPEILDAALVRPGRFDTTVDVPLPDVKGRQEIIELYLKKVVVSKDIDPVLLAKATPGFSGAQIEAMINSAALMGANRGADEIEMVDMEEARDKVIMGMYGASACSMCVILVAYLSRRCRSCQKGAPSETGDFKNDGIS